MSNIFDWVFTDTSKTQTPAEAQANYSRLQGQLATQDAERAAAGTISPSQFATNEALANSGPLEDPGAAASSSFWKSITFQNDPNDPNGNQPGVGSVIVDVFVIGAIGAALWAFFKFGGTGFLKTLTKKSKYAVWGIAGAAVLLLWLIYSRFKKTASDTTSTVNGVTDSIKSLI
jgi:hypothetical protein